MTVESTRCLKKKKKKGDRMPEVRSHVHHPVLYFTCSDTTEKLDGYADLLKSEKIARMLVCRRNGTGHYLMITSCGEEQTDSNVWAIWKNRITQFLEKHFIEVRAITSDDADMINYFLKNNPEYFGRTFLDLSNKERAVFLIPNSVISDIKNGGTQNAVSE